jgi:hypothetical protein
MNSKGYFKFLSRWKSCVIESASSPLVVFSELNDNIIKGLTSLLSIEQKIKFIAYTCGLWNEKCIYIQEEGKLDDIPHNVEMKAK